MPGQRADPDTSLDLVDRPQAGYPVDVDDQGRCGQPHGEQRHETLSTGQHLRVRRRERGDGPGQVRRADVVEGRGLHGMSFASPSSTLATIVPAGVPDRPVVPDRRSRSATAWK